MKQLVVVFILSCVVAVAEAQEGITTENFATHNLENVTFLMSKARFGNFEYEFWHEGAPVDSSSLVTYFDKDGSIFVGQQKKVTDFRIRSVSGDEFSLNSFQLSSNHPYPNPDEAVMVRGWRDGKVVTPPVPLEIKLFEPPGNDYDLTLYQGFDKVDEIKITGNNLQFTLESFTYKLGGGSVARDKNNKKRKH